MASSKGGILELTDSDGRIKPGTGDGGYAVEHRRTWIRLAGPTVDSDFM